MPALLSCLDITKLRLPKICLPQGAVESMDWTRQDTRSRTGNRAHGRFPISILRRSQSRAWTDLKRVGGPLRFASKRKIRLGRSLFRTRDSEISDARVSGKKTAVGSLSREIRREWLTASRQGQDKRGRHRSAAISHSQLSLKNMATYGNP